MILSVFHLVNTFKFVREVTRDFFCLVEYPTVYTTRCVLLTSASLYPLPIVVLLVISVCIQVVNTTVVVLIVDPVAVYLTNIQRFSILMLHGTPLPSQVSTCQSSLSSTALDKCTYFKSFRRHQYNASPSPDQLHGTVHILFFDYSPTAEKNKQTKNGVPCVLCTNNMTH